MLVKDIDNLTDDQIKREFLFLIDRCRCTRSSLQGKCTPKKCFPFLYYIILKDEVLDIEHNKSKTWDDDAPGVLHIKYLRHELLRNEKPPQEKATR